MSPSLNPNDICNPSRPAPRLRALLQRKRESTRDGDGWMRRAAHEAEICGFMLLIELDTNCAHCGSCSFIHRSSPTVLSHSSAVLQPTTLAAVFVCKRLAVYIRYSGRLLVLYRAPTAVTPWARGAVFSKTQKLETQNRVRAWFHTESLAAAIAHG